MVSMRVKLSLILSAFLCQFLAGGPALADDLVISTVTSQGVSGYQDLKGRDPVLTVSAVSSGPTIKILADAYVKNGDFSQDPIEYQFFVNRRLFSTQIQAKELPGAVGVDIGADVATPPFNYSVIATLIHPNRQFKTVIHGAVYGSNLLATMDCVLQDSTSGDAGIEVSASGVQTSQPGNDTITLSFEGNPGKVGVAAEATNSGGALSGTISVSKSSGTNTVEASGTIKFENSQVKSLEMSSSDGKVNLTCG